MLKTRLTDLSQPGIDQFNFAGFTFPKYVWTLPSGNFRKRIERHTPGKKCTGDYYHAPKPGNDSSGFYLESDGVPGLRWKWADEVVNLRHTGWFCDDFQYQTVRGVVFRLPNNRGFLAGWSMGEGMAGSLDHHVYTDEESAAYAADRMAERVAEEERIYQEENRDD